MSTQTPLLCWLRSRAIRVLLDISLKCAGNQMTEQLILPGVSVGGRGGHEQSQKEGDS